MYLAVNLSIQSGFFHPNFQPRGNGVPASECMFNSLNPDLQPNFPAPLLITLLKIRATGAVPTVATDPKHGIGQVRQYIIAELSTGNAASYIFDTLSPRVPESEIPLKPPLALPVI